MDKGAKSKLQVNDDMSGRKPAYNVKVMNKQTGEKSQKIGGAWVNRDGTISVILDPFVVIPGGQDILVTLFPNEEGQIRD